MFNSLVNVSGKTGTAVCKGVVPDASRPHVAEPPLLKIGGKALIIYRYIYNP